jgi:4-amino-4-deoxy-L-arabinose transferase-like glycosyltransferase
MLSEHGYAAGNVGDEASFPRRFGSRIRHARFHLAVLAIAAVVFLGSIISPPSLMDDVDAAHAQLARNMIRSGDWVIPRLDGVAYVEKAPLPYWLIAVSYRIFGVHDWAARVPFALTAVLLCWITALYAGWAFSVESAARATRSGEDRAVRATGFYSGLVLATSVGLFLFTRILLPDVMLTLCISVAFWSFQRALNEDEAEAHPRRWAALLGAAVGVGLMLKGLIALVIPMGGMLAYLAVTHQLLRRETWRRLHLTTGVLVLLGVAAPWHVLATLRMPPYFDVTMHSGPGQYRGFFWFYFMNEHVLRFLGRRYPHDYNTVPRAAFWLLNLLWLFPWTVYLPAALKMSYQPRDRAGRTRLLAVCWIGFVLFFFSFSTTQEYYSLPIYPALALLLGSALESDPGLQDSRWLKIGARTAGTLAAGAAAAVFTVLLLVRGMPAAGDISRALQQHPDAYTLSLGHMGDLTLPAFAYLRLPLLIAGLALLIGAAGTWLRSGRRAVLVLSIMMILFFFAARQALVMFDPYLSSRSLAESLRREPPGELIVDGAYYPFSSIFFYADRTALLLNGRLNNLDYGSYAPDAPPVFIDDPKFAQLWRSQARYYLVADGTRLEALSRLAAPGKLYTVAASGGKLLCTNQPVASNAALSGTGRAAGGKENRYN